MHPQCSGPAGAVKVRTYIPEAFTPFGPEADYQRWVVGGLYLRRHTDKHREPDGFFPIHADTLRHVLPRKRSAGILGDLVDAGVIEPGRRYTTGTRRTRPRSDEYRLTDRYRTDKWRAVILTHAELTRKVLARRAVERAVIARNPAHDHLERWSQRLELVDGWPKPALPLAVIGNGDGWFEPDDQGRIHTPLTSLNTLYRRWLRVGDEPLVGVDIMNSQPLMIALAMRRTAFSPLPPSKTLPPNPSLPLPSYPGIYWGGCQNNAERFTRDCLDGTVYERLMGETGLARPEVKKAFFHRVYDKPRTWRTPVGQAVDSLYPSVASFADAANSRENGGLARAMQRAESSLVIGHVCGHILRDAPEVPLLTLHDSLVTTPRHVGYIREAMLAGFRDMYGIEPRLTAKRFDGPDG